MTRKEFSQFVAAIKTYYPRENLLPNAEAVSLWYDALGDLDYKAVSKMLLRWVGTNKWSPTIADIRAGVTTAEKPELESEWTQGWGEVTRAISKFGIYREVDALESMSPAVRDCVKSIGWKNICNSENIGVERGQFRTMYESRSDRIVKAEQTQERLRTTGDNKVLEQTEENLNNLLNFGEKLRLVREQL